MFKSLILVGDLCSNQIDHSCPSLSEVLNSVHN